MITESIMNKMKFVMTGVAAGLFCLSMAQAQEGAAAPAKAKERAPRVGFDGMFAAADANADGMVSLEEFKTMDAKRQEERKARMGDKYDAAKAAKMPSDETRFTKLDANGDGMLTKDELAGANMRQRKQPTEAAAAPAVVPVAPAATPEVAPEVAE